MSEADKWFGVADCGSSLSFYFVFQTPEMLGLFVLFLSMGILPSMFLRLLVSEMLPFIFKIVVPLDHSVFNCT